MALTENNCLKEKIYLFGCIQYAFKEIRNQNNK